MRYGYNNNLQPRYLEKPKNCLMLHSPRTKTRFIRKIRIIY